MKKKKKKNTASIQADKSASPRQHAVRCRSLYRVGERRQWVKLRRPVTQTRNATICHLDARQWAPRNERFAGGRVGPSRASRPLWARASSVDRHTEHLSATICCADIDPRTASTSLDATNRGARLCCCSSPHVHTEMSNVRGTPPVHLRQNGNVARVRASLDRLQARSL